MLNKTHITLIVAIAVVVWAGIVWASGYPISWDYFKPFGTAITVVGLVSIIFDRVAWKWRIFQGWLVSCPQVWGTWKVELVSDWINPQTGQNIPPIDATMVIRQTFSTLTSRLYTKESNSYMVTSKFERHNDGIFELVGVYMNTPQLNLRGVRSEIHYGALKLEVEGDPIVAMSGHYWTDRGTRGTMKLTNRQKKIDRRKV
mgnify:CR=1 FL=1